MESIGESILEIEPALRLAGFLGVLTVVALWEALSPRRRRAIPRVIRWSNNLALVLVDTLIIRVAFPVLAVGLAVIADNYGFGVFNLIEMPSWLVVITSIVLLDFAIYAQHILFHKVPFLWRLHRLHHADIDFDVTTGIRFHPLEIALSMVFKLVLVAVLGPPALAVVLFEVILNATALFSHANLRLPSGIDAIVRLFIVTPDMHRVHHSIRREETDSNFGFNLSVWDRLLGTYRAQPQDGHEAMTTGIEAFRSQREHWLDRMVTQPFRGREDEIVKKGE